MREKVLAALDQGTTSSRTVIFSLKGEVLAVASVPFEQIYPQPGYVEHRPGDILESQLRSLREAVLLSDTDVRDIAAIGISNQRETTLLWDRETGECAHNALVWQCRRTAPEIEALTAAGHTRMIREKTGLVPDAYFSGTKLKWLLDKLQLRPAAREGRLCFGTVDTFLAWNLCTGRPHVTDATNASRTMLFNIHTQEWDETLLNLMDIPRAVLPEVINTSGFVGMLDPKILGRPIPVMALAGDQHAALFGQGCYREGAMKNTYGTGCFMLMNTGGVPVMNDSGLLTTMAWRLAGQPFYALEGSVFMGGAVIQWLRDELNLLASADESEALAASVASTGGVYMVPAHTGLGAPWWDMYSRGLLIGLTRGTNRRHIIRAALEAIAYQSHDLMKAMIQESGKTPEALRVDGGASVNGFLMQFQADLINLPVIRPKTTETTALGAALLAGLAAGCYRSVEDLTALQETDLVFTPRMQQDRVQALLKDWQRAVERSLGWIEKE